MIDMDEIIRNLAFPLRFAIIFSLFIRFSVSFSCSLQRGEIGAEHPHSRRYALSYACNVDMG